MIRHGFFINDLRSNSIVPIPKRKGITCKSAAYGSIAFSSIVGKIVDLALFELCSDYLFTSDTQFGFKKEHATNMCSMTLKKLFLIIHPIVVQFFVCFLTLRKLSIECVMPNYLSS
jgi:hypothetical protein